MTHHERISVFRTVSQSSVDSDIATAFQRRFHISVDESEQNNVSKSRGTLTVGSSSLYFDLILHGGKSFLTSFSVVFIGDNKLAVAKEFGRVHGRRAVLHRRRTD